MTLVAVDVAGMCCSVPAHIRPLARTGLDSGARRVFSDVMCARLGSRLLDTFRKVGRLCSRKVYALRVAELTIATIATTIRMAHEA